MTFVLVAAGWALLWFIHTGFLLAEIQSPLQDSDNYYYANRRYRSDLAVSIGLSVIPMTWLIAPFMTGFYENGWRITRRKS